MLWEIIDVIINGVGTDYQWLSRLGKSLILIMMVINGVRNDQCGYQCCGKRLWCLSMVQLLIMMVINGVGTNYDGYQ